jgi:hypothetical protein
MGQTTSREHAPLTFGYVNDSVLDIQDASLEELDQKQQDFVLANPHLYQLQAICRECTPEIARGEVFVSSVNESCSVCKKRKRLSLVKKDLADDLDYIDQTYYPDLVHYSTTAMDPMESELLQLEGEDDDEDKSKDQWSRLTIGDITPGKMRPRRLTGPSMAVDLSNRSLVKLSPSIGYLNNLTKLNL